MGQDQPKVIIWTHFDRLKAPMLHTKAQGHWPFGSGEEDFLRVLTIYGRGGMWLPHLRPPPPTHGGTTWNLASIGPVVSEKKIFENGGRTDDDQRTDDVACLYYILCKIYLEIFYVLLSFFFHHPSVTLSKFKLQRRELYTRHNIPWNYRNHPSNR